MNLKTKQALAVGLSVIGACGTLATAILVRMSARKEEETYQTLLPFKRGNIKDILMLYKVPIAVGAVTIASIVGSTVMSHKAQASIMSMAVLADQGWRRYKHQVKSTLGLDAHEGVLKNIAKSKIRSINQADIELNDPRELYFEETIGFFTARPEDIMAAYAEMNEMLNTDYRNQLSNVFDFITLGNFVKLSNAELLDETVDMDIINKYGWTMDYLIEVYNWAWVHMSITEEKTDDGVMPFKVIAWLQEPILLDRENILSGLMSLDGFSVEDIDELLKKKYDIQEKLYNKKG